ncbi:MAG TPA: sulfotransferase domain-containing protein, partial [Anaerolineales bacterium]|nr:sulfotransferase domain-containing protein [Anaerolineales bacterium]
DRTAMQSMPQDDIIGQGALLWKLIYRFVDSIRNRFPQFYIVRHEDLSRDPIGGFQSLYRSLGLDFTEPVKETIRNSSSSENPKKLAKRKTHSVKLDSRANLDNWKKLLSPEEVDRIRKLTEGVSDRFYSEEEWR